MDEGGAFGDVSRHPDEAVASISRDEKAVVKIVNQLLDWGSPFDGKELVSLSTRTVCTPAAQTELLQAQAEGEVAFQLFLKERLQSTKASFFDRIPARKLPLFTDSKKKAKSTSKFEAVKADRQLFTQLLIIPTSLCTYIYIYCSFNQMNPSIGTLPLGHFIIIIIIIIIIMAKNRTFDVLTLVQYELGPVPWAIATVDGGMVSTQKSKLLHALGKDSALRDHPPAGCCVVIDAMALLQAMPSPPPTFGALSDQIFRQLLANMVRSNASRVDFVTDQYWDISIKQLERQKRTG